MSLLTSLLAPGNGTYAPRWPSWQVPQWAAARRVMSTPPTIGALAAATAITSSKAWRAVTTSGSSFAYGYNHFTFTKGGEPTRHGDANPDYFTVSFKHITGNAAGPYAVEFLFDGTTLEFAFKDLAGYYTTIKVDDEYVSLTPSASGGSGGIRYLPITFASRAVRRITILNSGAYFYGVQTGPNDTVTPAPVRGPRCIVATDSFGSTGAAGAATTSFVQVMADYLGWDDVWASHAGGTGYVNPGTTVKLADRFQSDVADNNPEVVVVAMGLNDLAQTLADVQTQVAAVLDAAQAAADLVVAVSPWWHGDVSTYTTALLDVRDAIKTAADARGIPFLDVLEMPPGSTPLTSTTTAAAAASGASSISTAAAVAIGTTIEIAGSQRRVVSNVSGVGPYTVTLTQTLSADVASGATVETVGSGLWTGTGQVGSTTGSGNSDLLVSSDGTHPSQAGHEMIGSTLAGLIVSEVFAAA